MNNIKLMLLTIIVILYTMPLLSQSMPNRISDVAEIFDSNNNAVINGSMDELKSKTGIDSFIFTYFMGESTYSQNHLSLSNLAIEIQNTIIFYVRLIQEEDGSISPEIIFAPTDDLISQFKVPEKVALLIQEEILDKELAPSYRIPMDLTANVVSAITKTFGVIKNTKDNDWDIMVSENGLEFSQKLEYIRDYAGFDMNYYEFMPLDKDSLVYSDYTVSKLEQVFIQEELSSKYILMDHDAELIKFDDTKLLSPDFDKSIDHQEYRYNNLIEIKNTLTNYPYINNFKKVSDWPLKSKTNYRLYDSKQDGFNEKTEKHKLVMYLADKLSKNDFMPSMAWRQNYGVWKSTRCNIFVADFSSIYLPDKRIPWGSRTLKAHELYNNISNYSGIYEVSFFNESVEFVKSGYPVYINSRSNGTAGHIAILLPFENSVNSKEDFYNKAKVIQAGNKNGIHYLKEIWTDKELFFSNAKAFVYLNYLID